MKKKKVKFRICQCKTYELYLKKARQLRQRGFKEFGKSYLDFAESKAAERIKEGYEVVVIERADSPDDPYKFFQVFYK